jgi:hypothetical protein
VEVCRGGCGLSAPGPCTVVRVGMAAVLVVSQWLRVSSAGTLGPVTGADSESRIPGPVVVKIKPETGAKRRAGERLLGAGGAA